MPQPREKKLSKRVQRRLAGEVAPAGPDDSNLRPLSMSIPMHAWPVYECLAPKNWARPGELIELVITRRSDAGEYASAVVIVDLGCLGVKNAYAVRFANQNEYRAWLHTLPSSGDSIRISLDLAAKIVQTGIEYAGSLGFRTHRDYAQASPFLRDAHPEDAAEEVPTGVDGMPYFVSGPHDDVRKIIQQLNRKVGEGNYKAVLLAGPPMK